MTFRSVPALFVTNDVFLNATIPGGAQICTQEYMDTMKAAGFLLSTFGFKPNFSFSRRLKHRLFNRLHNNWLPKDLTQRIIRAALENNTKVIFLNQVELGCLAKNLREALGAGFKIIVLSHGLESIDFLHNMRLRAGLQKRQSFPLRHCFVLGDSVFSESCQRQYVDYVFCLSEFEVGIEQWLGARGVSWLPRAIYPKPLLWEPNFSYLGYLGTLNHGPNLEGLLLFLNALQARQLDDIKVRIVGGPSKEGAALQKDFSFVDYLGALPESELQSETGRWTCFIHPIFCYPRGCSTKLATAISWQIPIVTTHAGCRGYQWRAGSLCLADEPDVFVEMALNLLKKENAINAQKEVKSVCESSPTLQEVGQKICACLRPIIGSN